MRRLLDPLQLEILAADDEPSSTPMEWLQAALGHFLVLFVLAVVILVALAVTVNDLNGVTP
jgi:cytochrome b561